MDDSKNKDLHFCSFLICCHVFGRGSYPYQYQQFKKLRTRNLKNPMMPNIKNFLLLFLPFLQQKHLDPESETDKNRSKCPYDSEYHTERFLQLIPSIEGSWNVTSCSSHTNVPTLKGIALIAAPHHSQFLPVFPRSLVRSRH